MMFLINKDTCPKKHTEWRAELARLNQELQGTDGWQELLETGASKLGMTIDPSMDFLSNCKHIADFGYHNSKNNPSPALKAEDPLLSKLSRCYEVDNLIRYRNPLTRNTLITPLVEAILQLIRDKAEDPSKPLKYSLFSGHDNTISPLLMIFNQLDFECFLHDLKQPKAPLADCKNFPDTAANLVFELVLNDRREPFISVYYNLQALDVCLLKNSEEQYRCPLATFAKLLEAVVNKDHRADCGRPREGLEPELPPKSVWKYWALGLGVLFLGLLVSVVCLSARLRERDGVKKVATLKEDDLLYKSMTEDEEKS